MALDSENHKKQVTAVFDAVADGYDNPAMRFFSTTANKLVDTLKPATGEKLLDIAAGTGEVAIACAQAMLPGGRVIAIDLSEGMLAKARQKARRQELDNIDFFNMDAEQLEFKSHCFNHAICSFGLFFLPDMESALKEWVRVVKPGGKLLFSSFTEKAFQPMMNVFFEQLEGFGVQFEGPLLKKQRLAEISECLEIMTAAGLEEPTVESHQLGYRIQSVNDWWDICRFSGLRGLLDRLDQQRLSQFRAKHLERIHSMFGEQGLWMDVEVLISQGKVPLTNEK